MIRITSNAVPTSHIPNIKFVRSTDRRNSWNAREKTFLVGFGTGWALVAASLAIFDSRAIEFPTMKCSYASPSVFHDLLSLSPPPPSPLPIDLFINTALLFALLIVPMK